MLTEFDIGEHELPRVQKSSSGEFGIIEDGPLSGVPITGVLGDQQAACFGHMLLPGEVKNTYGTGCFMLLNTGNTPVQSKAGLLTTVCYVINDRVYYAIEGAVEVAGSAISWAKNNMGLFKSEKEIEELCRSVADDGDIVFVPAFSGLFSPYWRNDARGLFVGLSHHTTRAHLTRAIVNAPCMRTKEIVDAMESEFGSRVESLVVDGGMTVNPFIMQRQADVLGFEVVTKEEKEVTCLGAAFAAGLHIGFRKDEEEIRGMVKVARRYQSEMPAEERDAIVEKWKNAVWRSFDWAKN